MNNVESNGLSENESTEPEKIVQSDKEQLNEEIILRSQLFQPRASLISDKRSSVYSVSKFNLNSVDNPHYKEEYLNVTTSQRGRRSIYGIKNSTFKKCPLLPNGMWVHVPSDWMVTISHIMEVVDQALKENDIKIIYQLQESERFFYDQIVEMYLSQTKSITTYSESYKSSKLEDGVRKIISFGNNVLSSTDLAVHHHLKNHELSHLLKKRQVLDKDERLSTQSSTGTLLGVLVEFVDSLVTKPLQRKINFRKKILTKESETTETHEDGRPVNHLFENVTETTRSDSQIDNNRRVHASMHEEMFSIGSIKALLTNQSTVEKEENFIKILKSKLAYNSTEAAEDNDVIKPSSFRTEDEYDDSKYSEFSEKFCDKTKCLVTHSGSDESINFEEIKDEEVFYDSIFEKEEFDLDKVYRSSISKYSKEPFYETATILRSSIRPRILSERFMEANAILSGSIATTMIRSNSIIHSSRFFGTYSSDPGIDTDEIIRVIEEENKTYFKQELHIIQDLLDPDLLCKFKKRELKELLNYRGTFQIRKYKNRIQKIRKIEDNKKLKDKANRRRKFSFHPCIKNEDEEIEYKNEQMYGVSRTLFLMNRFQNEAIEEQKCMSRFHKMHMEPMKHDIACKICKKNIHNRTARRQYKEFYKNTLVRHERNMKPKAFGRIKIIENKPIRVEKTKKHLINRNYSPRRSLKSSKNYLPSKSSRCEQAQKSGQITKKDLLEELLRKVPKLKENLKVKPVDSKIQVSINAPLHHSPIFPTIIFQPTSNKLIPIRSLRSTEFKEIIKLPLKSGKIHNTKIINRKKESDNTAQVDHSRTLHKNYKLKTHDYETVRCLRYPKIKTKLQLREIDDFHYSSLVNSINDDDLTNTSNIGNINKINTPLNDQPQKSRSRFIKNRNTNYLFDKYCKEASLKVEKLNGKRLENVKLVITKDMTERNIGIRVSNCPIMMTSEIWSNDCSIDPLHCSTIVEKDKAINVLTKSDNKIKIQMSFNKIKFHQTVEKKIRDSFISFIMPSNYKHSFLSKSNHKQINYQSESFLLQCYELLIYLEIKEFDTISIYSRQKEITNAKIQVEFSSCKSHSIIKRMPLLNEELKFYLLKQNPILLTNGISSSDSRMDNCDFNPQPNAIVEQVEKKHSQESMLVLTSHKMIPAPLNEYSNMEIMLFNLKSIIQCLKKRKMFTVKSINSICKNHFENYKKLLYEQHNRNIISYEIRLNRLINYDINKFVRIKHLTKIVRENNNEIPHHSITATEISKGNNLWKLLPIKDDTILNNDLDNEIWNMFCDRDFASSQAHKRRISFNKRNDKQIIAHNEKYRKNIGKTLALSTRVNDNTDILKHYSLLHTTTPSANQTPFSLIKPKVNLSSNFISKRRIFDFINKIIINDRFLVDHIIISESDLINKEFLESSSYDNTEIGSELNKEIWNYLSKHLSSYDKEFPKELQCKNHPKSLVNNIPIKYIKINFNSTARLNSLIHGFINSDSISNLIVSPTFTKSYKLMTSKSTWNLTTFHRRVLENVNIDIYRLINDNIHLLLTTIVKDKLIDFLAISSRNRRISPIHDSMIIINDDDIPSASESLFTFLQQLIPTNLELTHLIDKEQNHIQAKAMTVRDLKKKCFEENVIKKINKSITFMITQAETKPNRSVKHSNLPIHNFTLKPFQIKKMLICLQQNTLFKNTQFVNASKNGISDHVSNLFQQHNLQIRLDLTRKNIQNMISLILLDFPMSIDRISLNIPQMILKNKRFEYSNKLNNKNQNPEPFIEDRCQVFIYSYTGKSGSVSERNRQVEQCIKNKGNQIGINQNHNFPVHSQTQDMITMNYIVNKSDECDTSMKTMKNLCRKNRNNSDSISLSNRREKLINKSIYINKNLKRKHENTFFDIIIINNNNHYYYYHNKRIKIVNQILSDIEIEKLSNFSSIINNHCNRDRTLVHGNISVENTNRIKLSTGNENVGKTKSTEQIQLNDFNRIDFNPIKSSFGGPMNSTILCASLELHHTKIDSRKFKNFKTNSYHQSIDINFLTSKLDGLKLEVNDHDQSCRNIK